MTAVRKFLFETSFDEIPVLPQDKEPAVDEAEADEAGEEILVPTFSEAEVNAARDEGFARGKTEGIREASGAIERQIGDTLTTVAERLAHLIAGQEQANAASAGNAVTVAASIVRKVFPHLNQRNGLDEVEHVVEQSLKKVIGEPRVTISVNAALHESLDQRLTAIASGAGYEGKVALRADSSIPAGDCRIEWEDGGAERDTAVMWREIDEIIGNNLGAGAPAPDRIETPPGGAVAPVDETETGVDDAEALVVDPESGAAPETSAAPDDGADHGADHGADDGADDPLTDEPLADVNSEPESLFIEEADLLAPPADMDAASGEPGSPIPDGGAADQVVETDGDAPPEDAPPEDAPPEDAPPEDAPPEDAPNDIEAESDAPPTNDEDMMGGAGETPSDEAPSPDEETVAVADAEGPEEATDEEAAEERTSDPTDGG